MNTISQSVSPKKLEALQSRLENTKAILDSNDTTQLASLTREQLLGDMMYAGTLGYFAQLQGLGHVAALQSGANYHLATAHGIFGYEPNVDYLFGVPSQIKTGGIHLDIPITLVAMTVPYKAVRMC